MRIAFITTSFPLTECSVSGVFVEKLAWHIAQEENLFVVVPSGTTRQKISSQKPYAITEFRYAPRKWQLIAHQCGGIPVVFKKHRWLILFIPAFIVSMLITTIRAGMRSDLIHANWALTGAIAGLAGKLTRTPVITTLRGSDVSRYEKSWVDRLILRICIKTNKRVIAVCKPLMGEVSKYFPHATNKLLSVHNGVDESFLKIKKHYNKSSLFRIISIGSLIPRKNMSLIFKALAELGDLSDIYVDIVGDGLEYDMLLQLGDELGLGERLRLTGSIVPNDLPEYLGVADVFVLSSYAEGRPNSVIEALASGVPVIATDIEGVSEIITHDKNGLLFPSGDHIALANALTRLKEDPDLRREIAKNGRNYIIENKLSWTNCAGQYLNIYKDIHKK